MPRQGIHSGGWCAPPPCSLPCLLGAALCNFRCPHRISFPGRDGCSSCPPCPLLGRHPPHPNGVRRAAVISLPTRGCQCLSSPPQRGLAPSSRPAPAGRGTGCRKKPLAAKNQRNRFPGSHRFMPLKRGVCSGRGKGGMGLPPHGTHKGHPCAAVARWMPGPARPRLRPSNSPHAMPGKGERRRRGWRGPSCPAPTAHCR